MIGGIDDIVDIPYRLFILHIVSHKVDKSGNGRYRRLDVMGDGEQQPFALIHDALYFRVGILQIFSVNAFFLCVP